LNLLSRLFAATARTPIDLRRWVVLDVETTGLDMNQDALLAIAAIALRFDAGDDPTPRIDLADSFEAVLHHDSASTDKDNILLHGIGVGAQRGGVDARHALQAFSAFAGRSPLVAFHAAFDRMLIERRFDSIGVHSPPNRWLDLEPLAAVLYPRVKARALDEWMAHFGIRCAVRHQAAADTLATAELLLRLWPALCRQQAEPGFRAAAQLAGQRRWLQPP